MAGEYLNPEECGLHPVLTLEQLKKEMECAERECNIVEEEWRRKNTAKIKARERYEKELYKDKTCNSCMYSIVTDFSYAGDHNVCGCESAPCTCCHDHCEYYKPDTPITSALKGDKVLNADPWNSFSFSPEEVEGLRRFGYDIYKPCPGWELCQAQDVVEIMRIKRHKERV